MIVPARSSRRLVGRDSELSALVEARRALSSGRGGVVLIAGEPGIGKSRLVEEFAASLSGGRAPLFALGQSLEHAPRPYGPLRAAMEALAASVPGGIASLDGVVRRTLAALVPDILPADARISDTTIDKAELFAGTLGFFKAIAAKRATVIALEDLHWADAATVELLRHVAARIDTMRLLVVATYRDDEIIPAHPAFGPLARLVRERSVRTITLGPLAGGEIRALLGAALGHEPLAPERIVDIERRCEGNPFFAEELLKHAIAQPAHGEVTLPISIRAMFLERIALLDDDARVVIDQAALLGPVFEASTLALVLDRSLRDVLKHLRTGRDLQILIEETGARPRFRFRHALARQTLYGELLETQARSLHKHIATMLLTLDGGDHVDELAYHTWEAGLTAEALRYNEEAGDRALAVHAVEQAASYYGRALELAADGRSRAALFGKRAEAAREQGNFDLAIASSMQQHQLLLRAGDLDEAAVALTRAAGDMLNSGRGDRGSALIDDFMTKHDELLQPRTHDYVAATCARMAYAVSDYDRVDWMLASVADPHRLDIGAHHVYWTVALSAAAERAQRPAWLEAASALRSRFEGSTTHARALILHTIAVSALHFADHAVAEQALAEAIAIDEEYGFTVALAYAGAVKAHLRFLAGRLADARDLIVDALAERDTFVVRLQLGMFAPLVALALGDADLAERCFFEEDVRVAAELGNQRVFANLAASQAALEAAAGRPERARAVLEHALEQLAAAHQLTHFFPLAARYVAPSSFGRLRALCSASARPGDRVAEACAALVAAILFDRAGEEPAAQALAELAAAAYRALEWPLFEAQALELAGRSADALALYTRCGAVAAIRRFDRSAGSPLAPRNGAEPLSAREREVALLVARGLTNRAIAGRLALGRKTVEKYVSGIYAKLGFSSRAELAVHVANRNGF